VVPLEECLFGAEEAPLMADLTRQPRKPELINRVLPPLSSDYLTARSTPAFTCKARLNDCSRSEHTSAPCLVQGFVGRHLTHLCAISPAARHRQP
jgi:hypothetical protein